MCLNSLYPLCMFSSAEPNVRWIWLLSFNIGRLSNDEDTFVAMGNLLGSEEQYAVGMNQRLVSEYPIWSFEVSRTAHWSLASENLVNILLINGWSSILSTTFNVKYCQPCSERLTSYRYGLSGIVLRPMAVISSFFGRLNIRRFMPVQFFICEKNLLFGLCWEFE